MSSAAGSERPVERPVTWTAEHPDAEAVDEVRDTRRTEDVEGLDDRGAVDDTQRGSDRPDSDLLEDRRGGHADATPLDRLAREDAPLMTEAQDPLGTRGDIDAADDNDRRETGYDDRGAAGEGLAGVHGMDVDGTGDERFDEGRPAGGRL